MTPFKGAFKYYISTLEGVVESDFDRLNSRAECLKGVSVVDEKEQGDDTSSYI